MEDALMGVVSTMLNGVKEEAYRLQKSYHMHHSLSVRV